MKKSSWKPRNIYFLLNQFQIISSYDQHGTMVLYNKTMFLSKHTRMTNFGIEFIIAFFNRNTWDAIHVIAIYKPPKTNVFNFNSIFKSI